MLSVVGISRMPIYKLSTPTCFNECERAMRVSVMQGGFVYHDCQPTNPTHKTKQFKALLFYLKALTPVL